MDSLASSQFTLVGENSICLREINFELGEIYTPRELYLTINDTTFCTGDTLILLPQSNSSALEWYNGNELIAVDDQFAVSNTIDITVVAPASGPCAAISQSLSLTRIEPATAQLQYDGDALLCSGESLLVSAAGTNGETVLFVNDSPLDVLTYEVTGSEEIRVQTSNSCFIANDTLITSSGVFPEVAFILNGDTAFCQGGAINIAVEGVGDLSLLVNSNPVTNWPVNVFTSATGEASATNVCGTVTDSFNVIVYPNPSGDFVYDQTTQTITAVDEGTYQWLLFGNPIEGATSQSYTITQTGAYALQTTTEFGCISTSPNEFINYIGVKETTPTNWLMYPNTRIALYPRTRTIYRSRTQRGQRFGSNRLSPAADPSKHHSNRCSSVGQRGLPSPYWCKILLIHCRVILNSDHKSDLLLNQDTKFGWFACSPKHSANAVDRPCIAAAFR